MKWRKHPYQLKQKVFEAWYKRSVDNEFDFLVDHTSYGHVKERLEYHLELNYPSRWFFNARLAEYQLLATWQTVGFIKPVWTVYDGK